jgi:chromate reductase
MTRNPTVALIVGSNRRQSLNRKLALALAKLGVDQFDFVPVQIDDLPMYNQDLESATPASVLRFKGEVRGADALLVVTPEHNRSLPAVLKNAIDWGSKPTSENVWKGKPAAITGTSPGAIGTAVGQQHLRQILGDIGCMVMGGEAYISFKPGLVDDDGIITQEATRVFLKAYLGQFAALLGKLVAR